MTAGGLSETIVGDAALVWLREIGYPVLYGPDISPDGDTLTPTLSQGERGYYSQVVLDRSSRAGMASTPHEV